MTTAAKNPTPNLILVTDFFADNGYVNSPPSAAYNRVNTRLNKGTYPCLRVSQYKRYITAETAQQILAENPPTPDEDEPATIEQPTLALVADEPTDTTDSPATRDDIRLLTDKIGALTDAITQLNQRIPNTRRK